MVSGLVSALMMTLSVIVSLLALKLRRKLGLPAILIASFAMQIGLIAILALTNSAVAIAFLFLRMIPNALSGPFIQARIQPLLDNESRATYLSVQSFFARLLFALTLYFAASSTSDRGEMQYSEIQTILGWYVLAGLLALAALVFAVRRIKIEIKTAD